MTVRLRWALIPTLVIAALGGAPTLVRAHAAQAPAAGAQAPNSRAQADLRIWSLIDTVYAGAPGSDTPESFDALVELTRRMGFSVADEHLVVVQQPLAEPRLGLKDQPERAAGLPADGPGRPPGPAVGRVRPDRVQPGARRSESGPAPAGAEEARRAAGVARRVAADDGFGGRRARAAARRRHLRRHGRPDAGSAPVPLPGARPLRRNLPADPPRDPLPTDVHAWAESGARGPGRPQGRRPGVGGADAVGPAAHRLVRGRGQRRRRVGDRRDPDVRRRVRRGQRRVRRLGDVRRSHQCPRGGPEHREVRRRLRVHQDRVDGRESAAGADQIHPR